MKQHFKQPNWSLPGPILLMSYAHTGRAKEQTGTFTFWANLQFGTQPLVINHQVLLHRFLAHSSLNRPHTPDQIANAIAEALPCKKLHARIFREHLQTLPLKAVTIPHFTRASTTDPDEPPLPTLSTKLTSPYKHKHTQFAHFTSPAGF